MSFPGYFKANGYTTIGGGKTFHPGLPPNYDGAASWSEEACPKEYKSVAGVCYYEVGTLGPCPDAHGNVSAGAWDASRNEQLSKHAAAAELGGSAGGAPCGGNVYTDPCQTKYFNNTVEKKNPDGSRRLEDGAFKGQHCARR